MSEPIRLPERGRAVHRAKSRGDRSTALALHALIAAARDDGTAMFNDVAIQYRDDHLRDACAKRAATPTARPGGLSLDEVRAPPAQDPCCRGSSARRDHAAAGRAARRPTRAIRIAERYWRAFAPFRDADKPRSADAPTAPASTQRIAARHARPRGDGRRARERACSRRADSSRRTGGGRS